MSDASKTAAPERFGRYMLLEPIGKGGMAEIFRAVAHGVEGFQRVFVIKRILKEKSQSQDFIDMFVAEARLSALLNHPNIVQTYDFGQIAGSYFISMEYLRGKDLLSLMRQLRTARKSLDPAVAAYIAQQVAAGLHYAHSLTGTAGKPLNIVHRDVSPSNIMLLRAGGVKLLDFGIAKVGTNKVVEGDNNSSNGFIKGKLSYLSPEQVRGDAVDARSDIFALGVCFWEMLTGRRLFFDKNEYNTMKNVLDKPIIPPSMQRGDVPTALDYILVRALERDLSRRYRSAKEMADDLEGYLAETHFAPGAVPRMLDDVFGADAGIFDAQMSDDPASSWGDLQGQEDARSHPLKTVPPLAIDGTQTGTTRRQRQNKILPMVAGGLCLVMGAGLGLRQLRSAPSQPSTVAVAVSSPPAPPAPVPTRGAQMPAAPQPEPSPEPSLPAPQDQVELRFDTQPKRAQVLDPQGRQLCITPCVLNIARAKTPVTLTLRKPGFADASHRLLPDRDSSVSLSLLRAAKGKIIDAQPVTQTASGEAKVPLEALAPLAPPPAEAIEPVLPASVGE